MITCVIQYTLDPHAIEDFEKYAATWPPIIERCGGELTGYYLPTTIMFPSSSLARWKLAVAALTPASRASSPAASGRSDMSVRSIAARVGSAIRAAAWAMSVSYGTARAAGARS